MVEYVSLGSDKAGKSRRQTHILYLFGPRTAAPRGELPRSARGLPSRHEVGSTQLLGIKRVCVQPNFGTIELASVERVILHYQGRQCVGTAPAELASAERVILHYSDGTTYHPAPAELASAERVIL